jgi:DNA-binding transcriptional regulator LsrR (DeoR family)
MFYRLRVVELTDGLSYQSPLTQAELQETLGLTSVHVNRMLRELSNQGLTSFRTNVVEILDLARLEQTADFDPAYLFLEPRLS